ncbi:MAG: hypothetical protein QM617_09215 [Comamonas sp.]
MTLHHLDGFGQFLRGTPALLREAGYTVSDSATVEDGPEYGTHAVQLASTAEAPARLARTIAATTDVVAIGFAFRASARGRIVRIDGLLDLDWPGRSAALLGVAGSALLIRDAWMYCEVVIDRAASTVAVWFNDVLDITAPLPDAGQAMADFTLIWGQLPTESVAATTRISSLYVASQRLGPLAIGTDLPTTDIEAAWTPSVDGSAHWQHVNLRPPEDDRYLQTTATGARALFTFGTPALSGEVLAVGLVARALRADLGQRSLGLALGEAETPTAALGTDYAWRYAAWDATAADLDTPAGLVARD